MNFQKLVNQLFRLRVTFLWPSQRRSLSPCNKFFRVACVCYVCASVYNIYMYWVCGEWRALFSPQPRKSIILISTFHRLENWWNSVWVLSNYSIIIAVLYTLIEGGLFTLFIDVHEFVCKEFGFSIECMISIGSVYIIPAFHFGMMFILDCLYILRSALWSSIYWVD